MADDPLKHKRLIPSPHVPYPAAPHKLQLGQISPVIPLSNYPIIEFVHSQHKLAEDVGRWSGYAEHGRIAMTAVAGGRAFRTYNALSEVAGLNNTAIPNLRGMVHSAKWRTLFRHINTTSHAGVLMEHIGYLTALASGLAEAAPKIETILNSTDSATFKGMQIATVAGTIAQRALVDAVPSGVHMIYRSLEGWCMIAGLPGGKAQSAASQCITTLNYADTLVQTTFRTLTDTSNQSKAVGAVGGGVLWVIDHVTSRRPK